jgi:bis(5'-nucleosyl)-tetraphosphatase (symmetrical)
MSTYAIGDLQGCLESLERLLILINFNPEKDQLWFCGDLANRGPKPVQSLRFIKALSETNKHAVRCVLGNHDLALLALHFKAFKTEPSDTQVEVLSAPDAKELLDWLRSWPLIHIEGNYILVHAGLFPEWTLEEAQYQADLIHQALRSPNYGNFILDIFARSEGTYGSKDPIEHARAVMNYFTRMRFCWPDGNLELETKTKDTYPALVPWFSLPSHNRQNKKILFGHWSALKGKTGDPNFIALDTGCVWGGCLTAFRLEDEQRFSVSC